MGVGGVRGRETGTATKAIEEPQMIRDGDGWGGHPAPMGGALPGGIEPRRSPCPMSHVAGRRADRMNIRLQAVADADHHHHHHHYHHHHLLVKVQN